MNISQAITGVNTSQGQQFALLFTANHLRNEYERMQALFQAQPIGVQSFLKTQAHSLAEDILRPSRRAWFQLPEQIVVELYPTRKSETLRVPAELRKYSVPGWIDRLSHPNLLSAVSQCLSELEVSPRNAVSTGARLVRYTTANHMVCSMLPSGSSVEYETAEGEEIPSVPLTPRFYLPQWVAFGDGDRLLVNNLNEAEADIASMQRFMAILHAAVALAPFIVVDDEYQAKRYGMLGQLVNQGRALARYRTAEMIDVIKQRAAAHNLNRGLTLSLPFFDDQALEMKMYEFEVIPTGRIEFVPAFVVRASRQEQVKIAQNIRLSSSTRKHLILSFRALEQTFYQAA